MKSGNCKTFISSWMDDLSIYCRCLVLILIKVSCSIKVSLERRTDIVCWFVLRIS